MIQNNAQQLLHFDHTPRDFHGHPLDIMWMPWDVLDRYQDRRFMIEGNLIHHLYQLSRSVYYMCFPLYLQKSNYLSRMGGMSILCYVIISSFCSAYDCFLVRAHYVYVGEAHLFSFTISKACEVPGYEFPDHLVYASTDPENLPATTFAPLRNLFRMSHLLMYLFHRRSSHDVALDPSLGPS